jgi:glyoxylase-like metal-dependent hydrolase (beta-lactamase superfamily II)
MDRMWGPIVPVPADRMVVVRDGDRLEVAGRSLDVLYTPGHAVHHVAFHDRDAGSLFLGDVGGVRMPGSSYVRPPTPPPDLDLEAWDASIDRLAALHAPIFYITHFGRFAETTGHLEQLRGRLREWEAVVLAALRAGEERTAIVARLQRATDDQVLREADEDTVQRYELASAYTMNVAGYERYLRKRHELPAPATPSV